MAVARPESLKDFDLFLPDPGRLRGHIHDPDLGHVRVRRAMRRKNCNARGRVRTRFRELFPRPVNEEEYSWADYGVDLEIARYEALALGEEEEADEEGADAYDFPFGANRPIVSRVTVPWTSKDTSRLELFVDECMGYFTGIVREGRKPRPNPPATLSEVVPTLYTRGNGDGTAIHLFAVPTHANALDDRIAARVRELAVDPSLWGYCCIYVFHWPGDILRDEPSQDGLLIRAGDRKEPRGLLRFQRLQTDGKGTIVGLAPPLFVREPPSWFAADHEEME
jgi:hypothetical protein